MQGAWRGEGGGIEKLLEGHFLNRASEGEAEGERAARERDRRRGIDRNENYQDIEGATSG